MQLSSSTQHSNPPVHAAAASCCVCFSCTNKSTRGSSKTPIIQHHRPAGAQMRSKNAPHKLCSLIYLTHSRSSWWASLKGWGQAENKKNLWEKTKPPEKFTKLGLEPSLFVSLPALISRAPCRSCPGLWGLFVLSTVEMRSLQHLQWHQELLGDQDSQPRGQSWKAPGGAAAALSQSWDAPGAVRAAETTKTGAPRTPRVPSWRPKQSRWLC